MTTVQFPREPDDALYEYLAEKAHVCGGGADEIWEGLCTRFGLQPADDREAFEAHYAIEFTQATGRPASAADIAAMRDGDRYEARYHYLNGQWKAWKARGSVPAQKYDDTLLPFLALMRKELADNCHKGDREGWLRMSLEGALDEIRHHTDKLIVPVMNQDREAIREHAADVANCAMMLADIAGVLSRE